MKKIIFVFVALLLVLALTGCSESKIQYIHMCGLSGNISHATVKRWYETDKGSGIGVVTKEFGHITVSEGTYVIYNDKCPICGE